jgi:hypothetical protein
MDIFWNFDKSAGKSAHSTRFCTIIISMLPLVTMRCNSKINQLYPENEAAKKELELEG